MYGLCWCVPFFAPFRTTHARLCMFGLSSVVVWMTRTSCLLCIRWSLNWFSVRNCKWKDRYSGERERERESNNPLIELKNIWNRIIYWEYNFYSLACVIVPWKINRFTRLLANGIYFGSLFIFLFPFRSTNTFNQLGEKCYTQQQTSFPNCSLALTISTVSQPLD